MVRYILLRLSRMAPMRTNPPAAHLESLSKEQLVRLALFLVRTLQQAFYELEEIEGDWDDDVRSKTRARLDRTIKFILERLQEKGFVTRGRPDMKLPNKKKTPANTSK